MAAVRFRPSLRDTIWEGLQRTDSISVFEGGQLPSDRLDQPLFAEIPVCVEGVLRPWDENLGKEQLPRLEKAEHLPEVQLSPD